MGIFSRKHSKDEDSDSVLSNDNFSKPDEFSTEIMDDFSSLSVDDLKVSEDESDDDIKLEELEQDDAEMAALDSLDAEDDLDLDEDAAAELEAELEDELKLDDDLELEADADDDVLSDLGLGDDPLDFVTDEDLSSDSDDQSDTEMGDVIKLDTEEMGESALSDDMDLDVDDADDFEISDDTSTAAPIADTQPALGAMRPAEHIKHVETKPTNRVSHELVNFVDSFDEVADDFDTLSGLISKVVSRNTSMQRYAASLKSEAARHSLVAEELEKTIADNDRINGVVAVQNAKILHLETDLESASKLKSGLKDELSAALAKLEQSQEALRNAQEDTERARNDAESQAIAASESNKLIEKLEQENQRLRESRATTDAKLSETRKELSDLTFSSSELSMQHEKLSKLQKKMLIEHEKLAEEHRSLHRDYGLQQTKIADMEIRNERLKAENQDVAARLASEKFSMKKDHDALNSELSIFRKQNAGLAFENKNLLERLRVAETDRNKAKEALEELTRSLSNGRKELSSANLSISELNLKYSADLLTLDQLRDENRELRARVETLQSEKVKLTDYEAQAKTAVMRAEKLEAKLSEYVDNLNKIEEEQAAADVARLQSADEGSKDGSNKDAATGTDNA